VDKTPAGIIFPVFIALGAIAATTTNEVPSPTVFPVLISPFES
jgi:hypothetical protein